MKIVMVINTELPRGLIANTAAVLGISLGKLATEIVGADITDADGNTHPGITAKTIPVLAGGRDQIKALRDGMLGPEYSDVTVVGFSEVAQKCLDYETYTGLLAGLAKEQIYYLGICIFGPAKKISKVTGNLALLR